MSAQAGTESTSFSLPGAFNPFIIILAVVASSVIALIGMMLMRQTLPIHITALLGVVAVGCVLLLICIIDQVLGAKLTITENTVSVRRLIGSNQYPWPRVEEIRVIAPTNSLGDNPLTEQTKRFGLGLFLSGSDRSRDSAMDADIILCTFSESRIEMAVGIVERINRLRPKSNSRAGRSAGPPKIGGKKADFRQRGPKVAKR